MKANEIRIGNYVKNQRFTKPFKVVIIDTTETSFYTKCEPIPIDEDWLLKFRFEKTYSSEFRTKFDHVKHMEIGFDFSMTPGLSMEGFRYFGHYIKIKYVHQLQNLYFALTGEELGMS